MAAKKKPIRRKRSATITSVAAELGMSASTVSRALRGEKVVAPETADRIRETAKKLGYRRDLRGVNLRTGRTNMLCAILQSNPTITFGDPATMHLIQGLIEGTENTDHKLVVQPVTGPDHQLEALQEAVESNRFDGFIIDHTTPEDRRVKYLLENEVAFVTFGRTELFSQHAYFDIDNAHAAEMGTEYLLNLGHKRVGLVDPPSSYLFSGQRLLGYRRALAHADIDHDPDLIIETDINSDTVAEAIDQLMGLEDPPTALVTSNEVATVAAVHACRARGLDLGKMAFASRDGTRFLDFIEAPVASCYFSTLEAGRRLSELLIALLEGQPVERLQVLEKTKLITR